MTLVRGSAPLHEALAAGRAIPAFTTYTLEATRGICEAAERTGLPVILAAGSSSFRGPGREPLAAAALAAAHASSAQVGVHLDHCTDPDEIAACVELGYSSVMFDGSALDFEANVAATAAVVERAHAAGVWVEGELAGFAGDEDRSGAASEAAALTDPEQAAEFVRRTGVDALAAAIGTVHGYTPEPVHVDFGRLQAIRDAVGAGTPLVLHGASGLGDDELRRAVAAGVAKVNVNAELRRAYLGALREALAEDSDAIGPLQERAVAAVAAAAETKLNLLGGR